MYPDRRVVRLQHDIDKASIALMEEDPDPSTEPTGWGLIAWVVAVWLVVIGTACAIRWLLGWLEL